jgi:hypothetical protein
MCFGGRSRRHGRQLGFSEPRKVGRRPPDAGRAHSRDILWLGNGDRERKYEPTGTDDAFRISNDLMEDSIEGLSL